MFFALKPKYAVLGDLNSNLIEFYTEITRNSEEVWKFFKSIPRTEKCYYKSRTRIISESDPTMRAALFFFLNRNCFNGIYRTNKKGHFNVPFSSSRVPKYPDFKDFAESVAYLRRAKVVNEDFEVTCREHAHSCDFFYIDPPYFDAGKRIFREYDADCFGPSDFPRLLKLLDDIDRRGDRFLVSFPATDEALESFARWNNTEVVARRTVSAKVSSRAKTTEIAVRNYQ